MPSREKLTQEYYAIFSRLDDGEKAREYERIIRKLSEDERARSETYKLAVGSKEDPQLKELMLEPVEIERKALRLALVRVFEERNRAALANNPTPPLHPLYKWLQPKTYAVKIFLQMLIGLGIVLTLGTKFITAHWPTLLCHLTDAYVEFLRGHPLQIVGYALAISAGIELAYMLFTPGPDEAIEPLLLGFAAAILLVISVENVATYQIAVTVLVFTICVVLLFWLRSEFIKKGNGESVEGVINAGGEPPSKSGLLGKKGFFRRSLLWVKVRYRFRRRKKSASKQKKEKGALTAHPPKGTEDASPDPAQEGLKEKGEQQI